MASSDDKNGTDDNTAGTSQTAEQKIKDSEGTADQPVGESENTFKLLAQAREFLASPTIRHQDDGNKREFLSRKGLSPTDIEMLLSEASVSTLRSLVVGSLYC
jgi:Pex14 N-terminal domain